NAIPTMDPLDSDGLAKMKFKATEPTVTPRDIDVDIAQDLGDSGGFMMSSHEADELSNLKLAHDVQMAIQIEKALAGIFRPIPNATIALHFWGLGGDVGLPIGEILSEVANFAADVAGVVADQFTFEAHSAEKIASYANRQRDYQFQSNLAAGEITQLFK